jgi:hypothetical protein
MGNLTRTLAGALILIGSAFGGLGAQRVEEEDVTILNDHMHLHKVFVFDAQGESHVLGFVGHDQVKTFDVPDEIEAMGPYRIALQQYLPLPGLGVPADAHPYKMTPVLAPSVDEAVSIVVGQDTSLSSVEVVSIYRQQQQR